MNDSKQYMFENLNKHKLLAKFLLVMDQEEFSEEDIKESISILHQTAFPEKY